MFDKIIAMMTLRKIQEELGDLTAECLRKLSVMCDALSYALDGERSDPSIKAKRLNITFQRWIVFTEELFKETLEKALKKLEKEGHNIDYKEIFNVKREKAKELWETIVHEAFNEIENPTQNTNTTKTPII